MYVARFRLRFLLQELDLSGPTVTIGRSSECQVTLDDPLVSRVHAQITLSDMGATVRDLESRNGVRVNDQLIEREAPLAHNDRIRLGSQDLVFLVADGATATVRMPRATGAMAHCKHCGRGFAGELNDCPRCGAPIRRRNDGTETVTDVSLEQLPSWTFRLIGEVIERALRAGRIPEAERMLQRAAREIDAPHAGRRLGREQLCEAARYALRLARMSNSTEWAEWAARLYRREQMLPESELLDLFEALDLAALHALRPELEALLIDREALGGAQAGGDEHLRERRLMALVTRTAI
jgi:hypothetical protein